MHTLRDVNIFYCLYCLYQMFFIELSIQKWMAEASTSVPTNYYLMEASWALSARCIKLLTLSCLHWPHQPFKSLATAQAAFPFPNKQEVHNTVGQLSLWSESMTWVTAKEGRFEVRLAISPCLSINQIPLLFPIIPTLPTHSTQPYFSSQVNSKINLMKERYHKQ